MGAGVVRRQKTRPDQIADIIAIATGKNEFARLAETAEIFVGRAELPDRVQAAVELLTLDEAVELGCCQQQTCLCLNRFRQALSLLFQCRLVAHRQGDGSRKKRHHAHDGNQPSDTLIGVHSLDTSITPWP